MEAFLSGPLFRFLILPLGTAILGVILKATSRSDEEGGLRKEDFAVGLNLMLTAFFLIVTEGIKRAIRVAEVTDELGVVLAAEPIDQELVQSLHERLRIVSHQLTFSFVSIGVIFVGLISVALFVRRRGWVTGKPGIMHPFYGIALPSVIGIVALALAVAGGEP